jgi:hypothetical protein
LKELNRQSHISILGFTKKQESEITKGIVALNKAQKELEDYQEDIRSLNDLYLASLIDKDSTNKEDDYKMQRELKWMTTNLIRL